MREEIVSFSQIISNAFNSIKVENAQNSVNIYDEWKKILSRIKTNSSNPNEGLTTSVLYGAHPCMKMFPLYLQFS